MFKTIYEKHNVPQSDRVALTRYFNRPNGIPRKLWPYFLDHKPMIDDCLKLITRNFLEKRYDR